MPANKTTLDEVHARLGYHPVGRFWSRLEIFFGLAAAGLGMLVGGWAVSRAAIELNWAGAGLVLFVLGWYLALAGHRSHLYQAMNQQTAMLLEEVCRARDSASLPTHVLAGIKADEHSR